MSETTAGMSETTAEPADRSIPHSGHTVGSTTGQQPGEDELRAAYEAELSRITSADLVLQTAASLLNLGARRLGLIGAPAEAESERDLEQVRDAVDAVRGLMPVLERRVAGGELRPLRDALSQLQVAYARAVGPGESAQAAAGPSTTQAPPGQGPHGQGPQEAPAGQPPEGPNQPGKVPPDKSGPGPAESSGRLWVPGR
jgi:hypothetical protein